MAVNVRPHASDDLREAEITQHPELPETGDRDHSLLITEAQQRELLEGLVEVEHDLRELLLNAGENSSASLAAAEAAIATFTDIADQVRDAARNAVTVEERIAHLDFDPE